MNPIVSTPWLAERLDHSDVVPVDVRWNPKASGAGREAFEAGRIPGAVRLDLDDDLSDRSDLSKGRHPLPDPKAFANRLAKVGIGRATTVVAYDNMSGAIGARLWWMLRWIGHERSAVLDGGIEKWMEEGHSLETGPEGAVEPNTDPIVPKPDSNMVIEKKALIAALESHGVALLDARDPKRYRGEFEPIDMHAGHIPGAINAPYSDNLTDDATPVFRSPTELRMVYEELNLPSGAPVACSCGSGVTACHDILAMTIAGFDMPKLYVGSWSEWSVDASLPQAKE